MDSGKNLQDYIQKVLSELTTYVDQSEGGNGKVLEQKPPNKIEKDLKLSHWIRNGMIGPDQTSALLTNYLEYSQHMHHPNYMGHQVAVPHIGSAIADLIHGVINNPLAIYEMGPSGATIEQTMINWLIEKTRWKEGHKLDNYDFKSHKSGGIFTHGGSLANLTALLAARAQVQPSAWTEGVDNNLVVVCSEVAHYAVARAVSIMGMGSSSIRTLPVDQEERMVAEQLPSLLDNIKSTGKKVLAVIGNACATSTGLYDPLYEIGQICHAREIWFHIDGAHGASALLSEKYSSLMAGIEYADSLVWDAHKMMRTSSLSAAVLFRDRNHMEQMFRQKGSYLFHDKDEPGFDLMPYAIECTKSALASKLFWVLALEGEKKMGEFVTKLYDRTKKFYDYISNQKDFSCPYIPESNILCFEFLPSENQLEIRKKIIADGQFYISTAEVNGVRYLRIVVMNPLTNLEHIERLLGEIRDQNS